MIGRLKAPTGRNHKPGVKFLKPPDRRSPNGDDIWLFKILILIQNKLSRAKKKEQPTGAPFL